MRARVQPFGKTKVDSFNGSGYDARTASSFTHSTAISSFSTAHSSKTLNSFSAAAKGVLKSDKFLLYLNSKLFLLCWWMVFMLHAADICYLVATTMLYYWILHDDLASYFLFGNLTFDMSASVLGTMNWGFAIVAGLHTLTLLRSLVSSIKERRLIFTELPLPPPPIAAAGEMHSPSKPSSPVGSRAPSVAALVSPLGSRAPSSTTLVTPFTMDPLPSSTTLMKTSPSSPSFPVPAMLFPLSTAITQAREEVSEAEVQASRVKRCLACCYACCCKRIVAGYERFMNNFVKQVFVIRGKYFDDAFLLEECVEVSFQVYQARRMSIYIAARWINNIYVGLIFINAISTPLIHNRVISASNAPLRRLVALTISALLNFVNAVVIPFVIFEKYIRAYDPVTHYYKQEYLFDDVWYANSIRENQQLFVTSLLDFVSTLWPHISLFNSLRVCESMLHRDQITSKGPVANRVSITPSPKDARSSSSRRMSGGAVGARLNSVRRMSSTTIERVSIVGHKLSVLEKVLMVIRFILYNFLWLSGVVVLGIHIDAHSVPQVDGCKLESTPWLKGSKSACVIMNVNCYRREIEGNQTEVEQVLTLLNPQTLFILSFTHCTSLGMPPIVRSFSVLNGIDIYNSTIHNWPAESSISEQDFPLLSYVYFVRSNLSSVPEGLLTDLLPPSVLEVYFYGTNMTALPDGIKDKWVSLPILSLEFSRFEAIPPMLAEMPTVQFLFLTGNPINGMPDEVDLFGDRDLIQFHASATPFSFLPNGTSDDEIHRFDQLHWLYLEHTAMQDVPECYREWYMDNVHRGTGAEHSLFGSPYCNKTLDQADEQKYQQLVCEKDWGSAQGFYPIDVVVQQRAL